jgi:hypothetical protein
MVALYEMAKLCSWTVEHRLNSSEMRVVSCITAADFMASETVCGNEQNSSQVSCCQQLIRGLVIWGADAEAVAALQMQKIQLLEASHTLPDPSAHSSLPGLFQSGVDDLANPGSGACSDCANSAQQLQQLQRLSLPAYLQ